MKNEYQELKRMRDDTSNSVYLREIALLSEKNDELRVTIDKLKKGGGIRGENERLKLIIERLNIKLIKEKEITCVLIVGEDFPIKKCSLMMEMLIFVKIVSQKAIVNNEFKRGYTCRDKHVEDNGVYFMGNTLWEDRWEGIRRI